MATQDEQWLEAKEDNFSREEAEIGLAKCPTCHRYWIADGWDGECDSCEIETDGQIASSREEN